MGQKVNPLGLRLGIQPNSWKSNWWTSSKEIYGLFLYEDQQIRAFIDGVFLEKGFTTVNITISRYHSHVKISTQIFQLDSMKPVDLDFQENCFLNLKNSLENYLKTPVFLEIENLPIITTQQSLNFKNIFFNVDLKKKLGSLYKQIERNPNLRQFKKSPFFTKTVEVFILSSFIKNGSSLISKYLAFNLEKIRRHITFIGFLRRLTRVIITEKLLQIEGLRIMIRGRVNGSDRRKNYSVKEGRLPLQQISAPIDYSLSDSFTVYGVFGVKVWICYLEN